jgi:hypothetical protein
MRRNQACGPLIKSAEGQLFKQLDVAKVSQSTFENHVLAGLLLIPLPLPISVVFENV